MSARNPTLHPALAFVNGFCPAAPRVTAEDHIERLCGHLETNAREMFVVCGKPDTQEGFEAAWRAENPTEYSDWLAARAAVGVRGVA